MKTLRTKYPYVLISTYSMYFVILKEPIYHYSLVYCNNNTANKSIGVRRLVQFSNSSTISLKSYLLVSLLAMSYMSVMCTAARIIFSHRKLKIESCLSTFKYQNISRNWRTLAVFWRCKTVYRILFTAVRKRLQIETPAPFPNNDLQLCLLIW